MTLIEPTDAALPDHEPIEMASLTWYAIRVAPQREAHVARELTDAGVTVFNPVARRWVRGRHRSGRVVARWRHVQRPLWVGYLLVGMPLSGQPWGAVRASKGYLYTVGDQTGAIAIPGRAVAAVHERLLAGEFDEDQRPRRRVNPYRPGQRVAVQVGDTGLDAVVLRTTGGKVLVELLASGKKVEVGVEMVGV